MDVTSDHYDAPAGLASTWRSIALIVMAMAGVAVLAGLVLMLGEANRQRDRALAAQRHSYDVMILARTLQATIARSEASLGRYVISGDQQQGTLYFEDWRRANETMDRLEKLTRRSDRQIAGVRALRQAFQDRGNELALTALNTNYGKNSQALSHYYQNRKAHSLTTITRTLDAIIAQERQQLEARTTLALSSVKRTTVAAKVLAVFGVMLVLGIILLGWLTLRVLSGRAIARADADAERERADDLADAVARATAELRTQEARLRQVQKMQAVGQLTGGIAHDFNNMLAVVLGGLELAQRHLEAGPDVVRPHLDSAQDGAVRAAALTRRLLSFARETAINAERIGIDALFADLDDIIGRTLGDGVTVVLRNDSRGWFTRVDRVQLENTIVNLAVNARDAMDGRGTLTIRAATDTAIETDGDRAAGDYLTISVTDTGCGIAPEVIERVFEPFFTTKPVGKGTGLGLSQTFAFARQVGGDVTIDSTVDRGTTVILYLPRDTGAKGETVKTAPIAAPAPAPVALLAPAPPPEAEPRALAILVVEDDPRVLSATVSALRELGHEPVACDDPLRAADMLDDMPRVDLILSDVLMPMRTGPEMIAALPAEHAALPVLFVTGYAGDVDSSIDLGGRPVLRKPFTLAALEHAITSTADQSRGDDQIAAE
jgi:signal transduction histidine kinase